MMDYSINQTIPKLEQLLNEAETNLQDFKSNIKNRTWFFYSILGTGIWGLGWLFYIKNIKFSSIANFFRKIFFGSNNYYHRQIL